MAGSPKVVRITEARRAGLGAPLPGGDGAPAEVALARGLREHATWAERALLEQYTGHVERVLSRILGAHPDLDDLVQEVFIRAFERVADLRDARALRGWLTAIAVFVAREAIRRTRRRRWLVFLPPEETPEIEAPSASPEARAALQAFRNVVEHLDADLRIAFTLRFVDGMELTEIADACGVSLATIKRRIKDAEGAFAARGRAHEALGDWFKEGTRWQERR